MILGTILKMKSETVLKMDRMTRKLMTTHIKLTMCLENKGEECSLALMIS